VVKEAQAALASDTAQTEGNIHVEAASCKVVANPLMLRQALTNLLQNALKFVAPGVRPEVKVAARQTGDRVRLEIRDNGIGIAPEHQQKIFRIFERLHSASEYPGTGIGLAIVQKAIVRMNGSLGLESAPGAGSCFWVELPKA
jgi:signal transduction histidine kinase